MPVCPPLDCMGCHIDWFIECQGGCAIERFVTGEDEAEARQREREEEFQRGEGPYAAAHAARKAQVEIVREMLEEPRDEGRGIDFEDYAAMKGWDKK